MDHDAAVKKSTLNGRWENKIPHHPKSVHLYNFIEKLDFEECSDSFCFKSGGDGDNGETLMYLMDVYFEKEDQLHESKVKPLDLPKDLSDSIKD